MTASISRIGFALLAGLLALAPCASATVVLYQTGFEPPTYTVGSLSGQDGWVGTSIPVVETATVFAGVQAVQFDATGTVGGNVVFHSLNGNSDGQVTYQVWFQQSTGASSSNWDVLVAYGNNGFMAQLVIIGGNAELGLASSTVGSVPVSRGAWHLYTMVIDFNTKQVSATVDGQFIGSGPYASTSTQVTLVAFGVNSAPDSDSGFWDNLLVTSNLDASRVTYAANLKAGDSHVNISDTNRDGDNICVNVYVFAEDEQMIACCTCPLTPNGLATLSAVNDLTSNTLTPGAPIGITIELVASAGTTCSASNVAIANLAPGMRAWGTTLHAAPAAGFAVTETEASKVDLSAPELQQLTSTCAFIQANGSGHGICGSCSAGAQGAAKR